MLHLHEGLLVAPLDRSILQMNERGQIRGDFVAVNPHHRHY